MGRKRTIVEGEAPAPPTTPEPAPQQGEQISKKEAVKRALAEGVQGPAEGADFIRKRFGLEMTPQHFSTYKSSLKSAAGKPPARRGRKPGRPAGGEGDEVAPVARKSSGDAVEAAREVKELCERYGSDTVRGLSELFGGR
jgi:hypothetical protein